MSLLIVPPPSQGGRQLLLQAKLIEDRDEQDFEDALNAWLLNFETSTELATPEQRVWIVEMQFNTFGKDEKKLHYSCLITWGTWNP